MPIGTLCLGHSSGNCAQAATLCCRGSKQHHRTSRSLKPAGRHSSSAIPAFGCEVGSVARDPTRLGGEHQCAQGDEPVGRSEEQTSDLPSLMRSSYAVLCLKKKKTLH